MRPIPIPCLTPALLFLLLAGCGHSAKLPPAAVPTSRLENQSTPTATARPGPSVAAAMYPPEIEEYYVGMIPDPEDPRFAYKPGALLVERRPARLRLGGDEVQVAPVFQRGPVTTARMADDHTELATEELASLALRSQRLITALNADNDRLRAQLDAADATDPPEVEKEPIPQPALSAQRANTSSKDIHQPPAGLAARATTPEPAATDSLEGFNLVRPNAENVIELDLALFATPTTAGDNPFTQVYQPAVQLRELTIVVSAAVPGPNPSVIINDTPHGLHSQFQGLVVHRIDPDTVYLRKDSFLLACPVSDKVLKLRLP